MGAGPVNSRLGLLCVFMVLPMSSDNAGDNGVGLLCGVWTGHVQSLAWNHTEAAGKSVSFERWPCSSGTHLLQDLG